MRLKKLLFIGITLLLLFIGAETTLRISFFIKRGFTLGPIAAYLNDETLGYRPNPGFCLSTFRFNDQGFRGAPVSGDRPFTIICIGSSTTFGSNIRESETYPFQLETTLQAAGYDLRVINAGVSGYSSRHLRLRHEKVLERSSPDLVLINSCWNTGIPVEKYYKNDHWPTYFLFQHSFLFRGLDSKLRNHGLSLHYKTWPPLQVQLDNVRSRLTSDKVLDSYLSDIRFIVEKNRTAGARTVFLYPPSLIYTDSLPQVMEQLKDTDLGDRDTLFYQMRLKRIKIRERSFDTVTADTVLDDLIVLDLNPKFESMSLLERERLFDDPNHPNADGNRIIARIISEKLIDFELLHK